MARARAGGDGRGARRGAVPCGVIVTAITGLKKCTHSLHFTPPTGAGARVRGCMGRTPPPPVATTTTPSLPSLPLLRSLEPYLHRHNGWEGGSWSRAELKREQGGRNGGRGGEAGYRSRDESLPNHLLGRRRNERAIERERPPPRKKLTMYH